jgi:hypothetical protein
MKKKLNLMLLLLSAVCFLSAQTGLQFSAVKLPFVTFSASGTTNLGTVPAGKVWKLENVQHNNSTGYSLATCSFRYNGSSVNMPIPYLIASTSISPFMSNNSPIWWPEGTVIDVSTTAAGNTTLYFSILEFSVQ